MAIIIGAEKNIKKQIKAIEKKGEVYDYGIGNGEFMVYVKMPTGERYCITYAELDEEQD